MHVLRAERLSALQDEAADLQRVLSRLRWRLGFERLLVFCLRAVMGCAVLLIGLSTAAWLMPGSNNATSTSGVLAAVPLVVALGLALVRWPSARQAALAADRRLMLDERLSTAHELARRRQTEGRRFDRLQIRDAIEHASVAPGGWLLVDRRVRREVLLALALVVLGAGSLLLPGLPRPRISGEDQTGAIVDPGQAELQQRALPLDARDPAVVDAPVAQPQTRTSADVARVQQAQAERAALDALSQALGRVSAAQPAAEAIQQGDYSNAKEQLGNLGDEADQLSDAAKQQLASALQQAANSTGQSDRQLADRERQAAQALGRGNYADQRQALHNLGDQVERSGARSEPADQLARELGQLQQQSGAQAQAAQAQGSGARASAGQAAGTPADSNASASQQSGALGSGPDGQQAGAGVGTGAGGDALGDAPSRLDSAGQSVAVPLMLGSGAGVRPPDGTEDQTGNDPTAGARGVSEQSQAQQTGQVAPEQNLVPSEQRPVVRGYFQ